MRIRTLLLLVPLCLAACGRPGFAPVTITEVAETELVEGILFRPAAEPGCYSTDERARHLVELVLGGDARYFHRDAETGEWTGNLGVRRVTTTMHLGPQERIRTGVIADARGKTLTVRFADRARYSFVFPTEQALAEFLGRIVGPRGVLERELSRTAVIVYERPCG